MTRRVQSRPNLPGEALLVSLFPQGGPVHLADQLPQGALALAGAADQQDVPVSVGALVTWAQYGVAPLDNAGSGPSGVNVGWFLVARDPIEVGSGSREFEVGTQVHGHKAEPYALMFSLRSGLPEPYVLLGQRFARDVGPDRFTGLPGGVGDRVHQTRQYVTWSDGVME
ncbi:hypothetical protein ACIQPR_00590 [Streptomyces sp. NPDC091280]|uniref:hypothetical protein n=1 Tax=Streptomyces sp. NPDC091280 TaxID=3365984 RepID=UPI003816F953